MLMLRTSQVLNYERSRNLVCHSLTLKHQLTARWSTKREFNVLLNNKLCSINRPINSVNSINSSINSTKNHGHLIKKHDSQLLCRFNTMRNWHPGHGNSNENGVDGLIENRVSSVDIIKKMGSYVWPKDRNEIKQRVVVSLGLLVLAKAVNVSVPFIFKNTIDFLNTQQSTIQLSLDTPAASAATTVFCLVLGYGIARAGSSFFNELRNAIFAKVSHDSIRRVANRVFFHLLNLDLNFHLSRQTGALAKAVDRGTRGINFILSALVFNIVPTAFEVGMVSTILWYKCGGEFAAVTLGCIGSYALFTLVTTQWRTKFRIAMNKAENESGSKAIDSLINYETVKFFNNEKYEIERYDNVLQKYQAASLKTTTSLAFLNFGQNLIFSASLSAIMLLAARKIMEGDMSVGDLVMVNGLLFQLSMPLNFLGSVYREVRQSLIDMQTMFNLLNVESAIKQTSKPFPLIITPQNSNIRFKDVTFEYTKDNPILKNLTFDVPAGRKVAIIGGSGSGKSTIIKLLYRFFDPKEGSISIDGVNINELELENLRRSISIVPQDPVLFHESILYNMHYGNLSRSIDDVYEASKMAELHNPIMKWPKQYDTAVGERGLKLSGGEKQRVAISRAILKNSPILVFDEATSSLDSITEQKILTALNRASEGRTTICVAHRLSTVVDADRILVLSKGSVVEEGDYKYLVNNTNSYFYKLWLKQHEAHNKLMQDMLQQKDT